MARAINRLSTIGIITIALFIVCASSVFAGQGDYVPDEILVKYRAGVSQMQINVANAHANGFDKQYSSGFHQVKLGSGTSVISALMSYSNDPVVEYAEPNYIVRAQIAPNDALYVTYQWNIRKIRADAAWDTWRGGNTTSNTVTIAVLDTGASLTHPDLAGKYVAGRDLVGESPGYLPDDDPTDENGHGTHAAGIAAAITNNQTGIAGVDWNARIMPVRVLGANGSGSMATVALGIRWAVDNGAKVINMSLGSTDFSQTMEDAIDYAHGLGVVIVAAAGNNGNNELFYPAASDHVIGVAATDQNDARWTGSNFGSFVDVAAPGVSITSTYWSAATGNGYGIGLGTSMAAPHVAGLAALIAGLNPTWTPDQIEQHIEQTATDLGAPGRDDEFGYGRIDAFAAIPGTLDHLTMTPISASVVAHGTQEFSVKGYNAFNNEIPGLIYNWTTDGGLVAPTPGASTTFTAQDTAATGKTVIVTSGSKTASAVVDIVAGSLDHLHATPASVTMAWGTSADFTVQGQDAYHNNISGLTYDWSAVTGSVAPTPSATTTYTAPVSGDSDTLTASSGGKLIDIPITFAVLDHIVITPGTGSVAAGATQSFSAVGYDSANNAMTGVVISWTALGGIVSPATGLSTTFTAGTVPGSEYYVRATSGTVSIDAVTTVTPAALDHLTMTPTSASVVAHETQGFSVQGYDVYNNEITGLICNWTTDGGLVAPTPGASTTFTAQDTAATGKTVTVTSGTKTASAIVDIIPGPLDHLNATPALATLERGLSADFTVQGQDAYHNNISGLTYDWSAVTGSVAPTPSATTTYTAPVSGDSDTLTASSGGKLIDIPITFAVLDHIVITPGTGSVAAGATQSFSAVGYDSANNAMTGVVISWTALGGIVSPATGLSTTFTAGTVPGSEYYVRATSGTVSIDAVTTVTPAALDHLTMTPTSASVVAHETQGFSVQGYDVYNNEITGLICNWTTDGGLVAPTPGASTTFTAQDTAATGKTVTVTSGTKTASAIVDIIPGPLDHLNATPALATLERGLSADFTVQGQDAYHNNISGLTYDWSAVTGSVAPTPSATTTYTAPVSGDSDTLTASSGGKTIDIPITLVAPPPSNRGYIISLYRSLLNRAGTSWTDDMQYWLNAVNAGMPRWQVAYAMMTSHEYHRRMVDEMYTEILGRTSTDDGDPGREIWATSLDHGMTLRYMRAFVYGSPEFMNPDTHPDTAGTEGYVSYLYENILNRDSTGDPGALYWENAINSGIMSRMSVAYSFMSSDEYYIGYIGGYHPAIDGKYQEILNRDPESDGLAYWLSIMRAGMTEEMLPSQLYGSQEYFDNFTRI